jgi:hypothetical protein
MGITEMRCAVVQRSGSEEDRAGTSIRMPRTEFGTEGGSAAPKRAANKGKGDVTASAGGGYGVGDVGRDRTRGGTCARAVWASAPRIRYLAAQAAAGKRRATCPIGDTGANAIGTQDGQRGGEGATRSVEAGADGRCGDVAEGGGATWIRRCAVAVWSRSGSEETAARRRGVRRGRSGEVDSGRGGTGMW